MDEPQIFRTALLQQFTGSNGTAGRGQHWIDEEHLEAVETFREFFQIAFGLKGGLVAGHPEVAYTSFGEDLV